MLEIALLIAPIFGLIVLGHVLRRSGIPSFEFWILNDKLVYWVLMPSLLFYKTSTTTYDPALVGSFAAVILGGFFIALIFGICIWRFSSLAGTTASSVMQGSARHNTFVALALAELMYGQDGLALATLGSALLIPATNLTVVPLMTVMTSDKAGFSVIPSILHDLTRNPLLLAVCAGILCNFTISTQIPIIHDMTRILGQAALPIMLLSVGASIRIREMAASVTPVLQASIGKMVLFPAVTFLIAQMIGLSEMQTMIALLFASVPTASSSYTLARQMGGDAPVMAAIVTIQTGISFLTIPITLILAQMAFG
jgi:predicted permease